MSGTVQESIRDRDVCDTLDAIVDEKGDGYREPGGLNRYFDADGNPSCIVGHVVARLTPDFRPNEYEAVMVQRDRSLDAGYRPMGIALLSAAQDHQDGSGTWGEALHETRTAMTAIRRYKELTEPQF